MSEPERRAGPAIVARLLVTAFVVCAIAVGVMAWRFTEEKPVVASVSAVEAATPAAETGGLRMGAVNSGVAFVDVALRGFLEGDVAGAAAALVVQQVACGSLPELEMPVVACAAGENPGALQQMVRAECPTAWVDAKAAAAAVEAALVATPGLESLSETVGGYVAVLGWPGATTTLTLTITSAGVSSYGFGCGPVAARGRAVAFAAASAGAD